MKTDRLDPSSATIGNLPGEFLEEARQKLLENRSSGLVPIRAGTGVGIYEACSCDDVLPPCRHPCWLWPLA